MNQCWFIVNWILRNKLQRNLNFHWKQGKSEGFESCDRPIVRKRPIWVKIGVLSRVTLKFDGWPWKTIGHLSFAVSSFVQHFIAIGEFKLELLSGQERPNLGQNQRFLEPCDLEIWRMTLKNNGAPLLCYFKLYASFRSHPWIQAGVTVRKRPIWVKIDFFEPYDLAIWIMNLKNNRVPLLCYFKLCESFRSHRWFETWVTVRKRPIWVKFDDF